MRHVAVREAVGVRGRELGSRGKRARLPLARFTRETEIFLGWRFGVT